MRQRRHCLHTQNHEVSMLVSATSKCKMCGECVNLVKDDQANSPLDSLRNGEQSYLLYCMVENLSAQIQIEVPISMF